MLSERYDKMMNDPTFREIMNYIDDVVMIVDREGIVVYVNDRYEDIFARTRDQIVGKDLSQLEGADTTALQALATGKSIFHNVQFLKTLGIDSVGVCHPLFDEGEIVGSISIFNMASKYAQILGKLERTKEMNKFLQDQLNDPITRESSKEFITVNKKMKQVLGLAVKVAKSGATTLIRGESGTGKEVMAKVIHENSPKKNGPFIKVNCAAIPDNLLESELFGYADGAFTGARKGGKPGKFELANGGTLFLDEIGDMDINMQVKLLRVLQEKEVERVGGSEIIPLDIHLIAATNQDLEQLIREGNFRQDLYYRLNVIQINILPLRKRKEDIPVLAHSIVRRLVGTEVTISPRVINVLNAYDWPGNVRELQNVMEYASIMRTENLIDVFCLPMKFQQDFSDIVEEDNDHASYNIKDMTALMEKQLIQGALSKFNNKSRAIKELGISRSSFYTKIKQYNIEIDDMEE